MKPLPAPKQPPEEKITPREMGAACNVVSDFLRVHPAFRGYGFEDLLQECLLHWLARRRLYRPGRGASLSTFLGRILRRRLLDILDREMAHKRRVNQIAGALPEEEDDEDGGDRRRGFCLPVVPSPAAGIHLRLAVSEALAGLEPAQIRLCELLKEGLNVSEIARELKKSRPGIHDEIKRVRKIFRERGLDEFL